MKSLKAETLEPLIRKAYEVLFCLQRTIVTDPTMTRAPIQNFTGGVQDEEQEAGSKDGCL